MSTPLLDAALRYAAAGLRVFPAAVRFADSKKETHPVNDWDGQSTTDPEQIKAWFGPTGEWRAESVCIDTGKSGIDVVDPDGLEGLANWAQFSQQHGLTRTWRAGTPGGGQHWFYRADPSKRMRNSTSKLTAKVDTRGVGGFVVAPPSVDSRGSHQWLDGEPPWWQLPLTPAVVVETVGAPRAPRGAASQTDASSFFAGEAVHTTVSADQTILTQCTAVTEHARRGWDGFRDTLNRAAFALGGYVGSDYLDGALAYKMLVKAITDAGQTPDEHDERWIGEGLDDGAAKPIRVVHPQQPPIPSAGQSVPAANRPRKSFASMLIDIDDLDSLPDPEPLIEGWLFADNTARLVGQPGAYKSFVALDMACCVALGRPWHGHATRVSNVLYVVGESLPDYKRRRDAWCEHNDIHRSALKGRVILTNGPVQIGSELWSELAQWCRENNVGFIIGDTQAKMTVGSKENDNTEQGVVFDHLDELRRDTGATLMLLHHTGHPNGEAAERGRGASVWRGSIDTELILTKTGDYRATLRNDRQKVTASGQEVGVSMVRAAGSLAVSIDAAAAGSAPKEADKAQQQIDRMADAVAALLRGRKAAGKMPMGSNEICESVTGRKTAKLAALAQLEENGDIEVFKKPNSGRAYGWVGAVMPDGNPSPFVVKEDQQ